MQGSKPKWKYHANNVIQTRKGVVMKLSTNRQRYLDIWKGFAFSKPLFAYVTSFP